MIPRITECVTTPPFPEKDWKVLPLADRCQGLTGGVRQGGVGAGVQEPVGPRGVVLLAGLRRGAGADHGPRGGEVHRVLGAGRGGGAAVGREGARRGARGAGAEVGQVRPILQKKHKTLIWS